MAQVHFDPDVGGDGSTVSDDDNPNTGLRNYGHTTRFVPALAQVVAIAGWVKTWVLARKSEVSGYVDTAIASAGAAGAAATAAADAATTASGAAEAAGGSAAAAGLHAVAAEAAAAAAQAIVAGDIIDDETPASDKVFSSQHVAQLLADKVSEDDIDALVGNKFDKAGGELSGPVLFKSQAGGGEYDAGSSGIAKAIDFSAFPYQRMTLDANCTLTFAAMAGGFRGSLKVVKDNNATSRAITWPAGTRFLGGLSVDGPAAVANAVAMYSIYFDGNVWWVAGGRW